MAKIDVLNTEGKKVKELDLNENIFGITPNEAVVHSVVLNYLANQRQGTQSTKTRAEVSGGGRKPWRQKGTGRARQGSIRAPQWIKGGIALGPKPRSYTYRINKKEKRLALNSVLSAKLKEKELIVVDKFDLKDFKTADMVKVLNNLKTNNTLIVLDNKDDKVFYSTKNIPNVKTVTVDVMNVYEILRYTNLILTEASVKKIEEVYA